MDYKKRTGCPFSFSMATFGDKWTLLILREMIIGHKQYYAQFKDMEEGISTNILADRLKEMELRRLITKRKDPDNKVRWIYRPTEKALDLIPMFFEMALWSAKYDPYTGVTKQHVEAFTEHRAQTVAEWRKPFEA